MRTHRFGRKIKLPATIATGHGQTGRSTDNTFSELKRTTDLGIAAMDWPLARKWVMTGMDSVTKLVV